MRLHHGSQQIDEVRRRIGRNSADMMRWAIRFSEMNLTALSSADMLNVCLELATFAEPMALMLRPGDKFPWRIVPDNEALVRWKVPDVEKVLAYQDTIHSTLEDVVKGRMIEFHTPTMTHCLLWGGLEPDDTELAYLMTADKDPDAPYTLALLRLLMLHGGNLRSCLECEHTFLAERRNQTFCSSKCQTRAGTRRYRTQHGMITGRPRGRPPKMRLAGAPAARRARKKR
jgi:hypothetical protein